MASLGFNRHRYRLSLGDFRPATAVVRALLTSAAYTPNEDHNTVSDVTNEITTTGYARITVGGLAVAQDNVGDQAVTDANDLVFPAIGNSTQTAAWVVLFERLAGADAGTDPLITALDMPNTLLDGTTLTLQLTATGIYTVTKV